MSIVIAVMIKEQEVVMYGDKRVVHCNKRFFITRDDFIKIVKLTDECACGIIGDGIWSTNLLISLRSMNLSLPSEIINAVKKYPAESCSGGTFILGGLYDDGYPFIWTLKVGKEDNLILGSDAYIVASEGADLVSDYTNQLFQDLDEHEDIHLACKNTIKYASKKNPTYISPTFDSFSIFYKP